MASAGEETRRSNRWRWSPSPKLRVISILSNDFGRYPDISLGGWPGTVIEVHKDGMYTVPWSQQRIAAIDPVVKSRSEKHGTVLEVYWLGDDDLEPDPSGPLEIEQPMEITTKPLSPRNEDHRMDYTSSMGAVTLPFRPGHLLGGCCTGRPRTFVNRMAADASVFCRPRLDLRPR